MRRLYLVLIVAAVVVFVAISAVLARVLSIDGAERTAITSLVSAEARGDAPAAAAKLKGCSQDRECRQTIAQDAARLRRAGRVAIVQLQPSAGFSLQSTVGTARVVWTVGGSLPIVQCVRVRRAGDVISGLHVELLALTPRIKTDGNCPSRF